MREGYITPKQLFDAMDNMDMIPKSEHARLAQVFEDTMKTIESKGFQINDTGT
jgi:hypothetical protein